MKTALTQLIEELNGNSFQDLFSNQNYIKEYLETRIKSIYLDIEKGQIMEAYTLGHCMHDSNDENSAEDYYQQTYNHKQ